MFLRILSNKYFWLLLVLGLGVWAIVHKKIAMEQAARDTGKQAAQNAAQQNGYTTYNTGLYKTPWWNPMVRFLRANTYVPIKDASEQQYSQQ